MKDIIRYKLSLLKEGPQRAMTSDYLRTMYRITILTQQHKHDEYFMREDAGDFIAAAIVDIKGNIRISQVAKVPAGDLKNNRLGIVRDTKDYMQFYVMAGRGIEHPDTYKTADFNTVPRNEFYTRTVHLNNPMQSDGKIIKNIEVQIPKEGSPANDARIKTYLLYGPQIIDFVEKNLANPIGYQDGKAPEIRNSMNIQKKIEIIRKDAEDQIINRRLPRVNLIQTFNKFKQENINNLSPDEQLMMDTTTMTKKFLDFYINSIKGSQTQQPISLSKDDADDVLNRQAKLQAKVAAMRARRG